MVFVKKVNVKFELAYYDSAVQRFNHYTTMSLLSSNPFFILFLFQERIRRAICMSSCLMENAEEATDEKTFFKKQKYLEQIKNYTKSKDF